MKAAGRMPVDVDMVSMARGGMAMEIVEVAPVDVVIVD